MRRILVVANETLGGATLRERLALKRSTDVDLELFVLVPAPQPTGDKTLEVELAALRALRYQAEGAVGEPDAVTAVRSLLSKQRFDEIILLTLPVGGSRWLRMDLPHRLARVTKLPVDHVIGEEPAFAEETRVAELPFPGVPSREAAGPVQILLGEDNDEDAERTRLALQRCPTPNAVETVPNGAEAVERLRSADGGPGVDLVLVDLKMPVMDGFELLETLGRQHDLERLAVVVLTTSDRMEDRERAHRLGAHAYITKEPVFPIYRDVLNGLLAEVAPNG